MENHAVVVANQVLVIFAIMFITGAVFGKLAGYVKVPDIVLYVAAGVLLGPSGLKLISIAVDSPVNQLVLTLGASLLLFHGGLGVSCGVLKSVWLTLLLAATVSVLVMVAIVGFTAHMVLGIGLMYAFLLAAIIAPTDPATLVPIFLSVKIKERLAQTVLSESAFNDATGAITTFTILGVIATGELSVAGSLMKFLIMAGGGILVGLFYGLTAGFLVTDKSTDIFSEYAQVIMLPVIIASYMTAEHFGASGFMAVFIAGLVFGNLDEMGWTMKEESHDEIHSFIHIASLLLRIAIFMLLGSHVDFDLLQQYLLPGLAVVAVFMFIARPIAVLCCTLPDKKAKWERNEILFMFWTRETGVIPAALVGMLAGTGIENIDVISSVAFLAILATIIIQATTTEWLAKRLNLLVADDRAIGVKDDA
ncbi:MAG: sodium:proton antiporter [Pelosinus sp.]|nr:sodium:proton antiporter [Pelosinus sp.]